MIDMYYSEAIRGRTMASMTMQCSAIDGLQECIHSKNGLFRWSQSMWYWTLFYAVVVYLALSSNFFLLTCFLRYFFATDTIAAVEQKLAHEEFAALYPDDKAAATRAFVSFTGMFGQVQYPKMFRFPFANNNWCLSASSLL